MCGKSQHYVNVRCGFISVSTIVCAHSCYVLFLGGSGVDKRVSR